MTAATTDNGKAKKLMGDDLKFERLDAIHMRDVAESEGVQCTEPSAKALATALQKHFRDKYGAVREGDNELLECSTCKGYSPARLTACAFCGEGDDDAPPADKPPPAKAEAPKAEAAPPTKDEVPRAKKLKSKDKAAKAESPAPAAPTSTAMTKAEPAAIVKDDTVVSSELLTESTLDDQIKKVRTLINDHIASRWRVGQALLPLHDKDLWKLRVDSDGKQRWKTFEAFCVDELGFTAVWAYGLMNVAKEYSEEQYVAIGPKKLLAVLSAPKEERAKLLKMAEDGASRRTIEKEVREANTKIRNAKPKADRDGVVRTKKDGSRGGSGTKKAAEPRITVASILGTETKKAYKKPAQTRGVEIDEKNLARAKRVSDAPWTRLALGNSGVYLDVTMKANPSGELSFVFEFRRDG